jgi:uncharacterized protein YecE (DUF72 family)
MAGRLLLGTSGFAYKEWVGEFYPPGTKPDAMLRRYAERFPSVEINYTFQRHPSEKMLAKWIADTPDDFVFALKANRAITHMYRLKPTAAPSVAEFFAAISAIGARTGPILFQCAPNWKADVALLREFLSLLPEGFRYAFEFRHESCRDDAVFAALAERDVAWCVADADDYDAPLIRTSPAFTYVRLRKTVYEDEPLARWGKEIGEALGDGSDVYCYFKHEDEGRGVHFAHALARLMTSDATPEPAPGPAGPASGSSPPETSGDPERT